MPCHITSRHVVPTVGTNAVFTKPIKPDPDPDPDSDPDPNPDPDPRFGMHTTWTRRAHSTVTSSTR